MALTAEPSTLETLYNTLKNNVTNAYEIRISTDRDLGNVVWQTPNAEAFRAAWDQLRPVLQKFEETLAAAATGVATPTTARPGGLKPTVNDGVANNPNASRAASATVTCYGVYHDQPVNVSLGSGSHSWNV
jgi:hypothetical protein